MRCGAPCGREGGRAAGGRTLRIRIDAVIMSKWTEQRLQRLFARYNRRFWAGHVREVRVRISGLDGNYGEWDVEQDEIRIDIARHGNNDRELRATLLHEMVHVVAGAGHGRKFWIQIERLISTINHQLVAPE